MSEEDAKKEWGDARRARRRQYDKEDADRRLDHRTTRSAKYKDLRIHITIAEDIVAAGKAKAAALNYGAGMSFSEYVEMLIARDTKYGERARDARREYAMEHKEEPEP